MSDVSLSLSGGLNAPSTKAFLHFIEFLNDEKPPMFVEQALTYVLRTEPPRFVTVDGLVDLLVAWAEDRVGAGHPMSESFLLAVRKIGDAERSNAIHAFEPRIFYPQFFAALRARCPQNEIGSLESGLASVHEEIEQRWTQVAEPEFEETEQVEIDGRRRSPAEAVVVLLERLESSSLMADEAFDRTIADLDHVLVTRAGFPVRTYAGRVVTAAVGLLNAGQVRRSARAVALAYEITRRCEFTEAECEVMWEPASMSALDPGVVGKIVNDEHRQEAIATLVRCLPELRVERALYALEHERSRDRRRFLLKALELHGAEALGPILDRLEQMGTGSGYSWYFARNLVYVVTRMEIALGTDRRRALDAIAPFLTGDQPQLRTTALLAIKRLAGQGLETEATRAACGALEPRRYRPWDSAARDSVFRHVCAVVDFLVTVDTESSLREVARVAIGGADDFGFGPALSHHAIEALASRRAPLPRGPAVIVADHLSSIATSRLGRVFGRFAPGVDMEACKGLLRVLRMSDAPEARTVLEHPRLRKIAASA